MTEEKEPLKFETSENQDSTEKKTVTYKSKRIVIPTIIGGLALIFGLQFIYHSYCYVSTEDAFIEGHIVRISPKVSGNITKVYIDDNQKVEKGALLAEIDPQDYQVKYEQAKAKLEAAMARQKGAVVNVGLTSITSDSTAGQTKAALSQVNHDVVAAKAEINFAQAEFDRYTQLYSKGVVSKQDLDKVSTNYKVAQEKLSMAFKAQDQATEKNKGANTTVEQVAMSDAQLKVANAEIKQLQAAAKQAELELSYTKIYAPQAGNITSRSVEEGAFVQTGQPLLAIVPTKTWILANFKETQLTNMKPGQKVNIKIDAYPNKDFKGHVDSIQLSTGSKTSLFPPENAVGSFVKVVQRVPVKIVFDKLPEGLYTIAPGMSVVPEVRVK